MIVIVAKANGECTFEPEHPHSLVRTFIARIYGLDRRMCIPKNEHVALLDYDARYSKH